MHHAIIPKDGHATAIEAYFAGRQTRDAALSRIKDLTIVCFTNRCGSTLICSALSRLGMAGRPNKYLNYEFLNHDAVVSESIERGFQTFDDYISSCVRLYGSDNGAFTVKASASQLNWLFESGIIARLSDRPRFIFARRRNLIRQAVSFAIASQTGEWTSLHAKKGNIELQMDPIGTLFIAKGIAEQNSAFELLFNFHEIEPHTIFYEDVADDPDRLISKLASLYGRDASQAGSSLLPVRSQRSEMKELWEKAIRNGP